MIPIIDIGNDISQHKIIKDMLEKEYLNLAHNVEFYDSEEYVSSKMTFTLENKVVQIPVIYDYGKVDLPFLRPDAYLLLVEMLERLKEEFDAPSSYLGDDSKFKDHPVYIKSALRAGDDSWASTGLFFRIQITGYKDFENKILVPIIQEQAKIFNLLKDDSNLYFKYKKVKSDTYDILVHPPERY